MCCQSLAGNSYKSHVVCKEGAMTCVCVWVDDAKKWQNGDLL